MYAALIIDADADAQFAIQQAFCDDPIEFRCSTSAPEGIEEAASSKTDLVLIRIELPSSSGFSVFSKLRRNSATKEIPVVLYASDVADDVFTRHASLRTHAEGYLRLPIQRQELHSLIRPILSLPDPQPTGPTHKLDVELQQGPWDQELGGQELDSALDSLDPYDPEPEADASSDSAAVPRMNDLQDPDLEVPLPHEDAPSEALDMTDSDEPIDFAPLDDVAFDEVADEVEEPAQEQLSQDQQPPKMAAQGGGPPRESSASKPSLSPRGQGHRPSSPSSTGSPSAPPKKSSAANLATPTLAPVALPSEPPTRHAPDGALSERRELLALKNQLLAKDRELIELREELGRHEQEDLERRKSLRAQQSKVAELQASVLAGEETQLVAQEQNQTLARDLASLRIRSEEQESELSKLRAEHQSTLVEQNRLNQELSSLREDLKTRSEDLEQASSARDLAQTKVQELEAREHNLTAQLAELKSSLQERDTTLRVRHEQVTAAKSVLSELLTRLEVS